jgi:hypothetical protein
LWNSRKSYVIVWKRKKRTLPCSPLAEFPGNPSLSAHEPRAFGKLQVAQTHLQQADGLAIDGMDQAIELRARESCEFFVFRLPPEKE